MEDLKNLRKLNEFDVLEMARQRGLIVGRVIMDSQGLIKFCKVLGFEMEELKRFLE
jgi:hypothetical protein